MSEYLPFDLETALQHPERVVTRDGRKVIFLQKLPKPVGCDRTLVAQLEEGSIATHSPNGVYSSYTQTGTDLFLLPESVEGLELWVNFYVSKNDMWGTTHATRGLADLAGGTSMRFACVKLTVKKGEGL